METLSQQTSLLQLPRVDLEASDKDELVLTQLPDGIEAKDLDNAQIVANAADQQAVLLTKTHSYYLSHVETSNCLVMVPPNITMSHEELVDTPVTLLHAGGSGASFLELTPKKLSLLELRSTLPIWDPSEPCEGRSIESLSYELQQSAKQIERGLLRLEAAVCIEGKWVWLAEEVLNSIQSALISALSEEFDDYALGVHVEELVQCAYNTMATDDLFGGAEDVIRQCLVHFSDSKKLKETLNLEVSKVAACVAHQILSSKSDAWEETELLKLWKSRLPGVGSRYEVNVAMLRGIAIGNNVDGQCMWRYIPANHSIVPPGGRDQVERVFVALFAWKEALTMDELEPYLEVMADSISVSTTDLLLQYTTSSQRNIGGISCKIYSKR